MRHPSGSFMRQTATRWFTGAGIIVLYVRTRTVCGKKVPYLYPTYIHVARFKVLNSTPPRTSAGAARASCPFPPDTSAYICVSTKQTKTVVLMLDYIVRSVWLRSFFTRKYSSWKPLTKPPNNLLSHTIEPNAPPTS